MSDDEVIKDQGPDGDNKRRVEAILCVHCGRWMPNWFTLQNGPSGGGGVVRFHGCSECLCKLIENYKILTGPKCYLCGSEKIETMIQVGDQPVSRLECPIHVRSRELLGQSLKALTGASEGRCPPNTKGLVDELAGVLGVKA